MPCHTGFLVPGPGGAILDHYSDGGGCGEAAVLLGSGVRSGGRPQISAPRQTGKEGDDGCSGCPTGGHPKAACTALLLFLRIFRPLRFQAPCKAWPNVSVRRPDKRTTGSSESTAQAEASSNDVMSQAMLQQSQALTLVAHLVSRDAVADAVGLGGATLSTRGAVKREKLQQELSHKTGAFMLQVS